MVRLRLIFLRIFLAACALEALEVAVGKDLVTAL